MANPVINPSPFGGDNAMHTVTGSDFAYFDVEVNDLSSDAEFNITVPSAAVVVEVWMTTSGAAALTWNPAGTTQLLGGGGWQPGQVAVGSWQVNVLAGASVTDPAVILVNSGGPTGSMRIRARALAGAAISGQAASGTRTVRVVADPSIMSAAPQFPNVVERTNCTLQGNPQVTMVASGVVPGELNSLPSVRGIWEKVSANPTFALTQAPPSNATFKVPGVYADVPFTFRFRAYYDINGNTSFDAANEPETNQDVPVTFKAATHRMVMVMDRSGSMGGTLPGGGESKWNASKRAAHIWLDLFAAFRSDAGQTAGFITFEDTSCGYPAPASATDVTFRNPANGAAAAGLTPLSSFSALNNLNLGNPGSCTPIGDALKLAFTQLEATPLGDTDLATILLLTDGYENSGAFSIKSPPPGGTQYVGPQLSATLKSKLAIYVIGCGQSVDEDALNGLPGIAGLDLINNGYYRLAPQVHELLPSFAQMMSNSIDATDIGAVLNGPLATATAATCSTNPGETRLAIVVPWDQPGHNLRLSRRAPGVVGWTPVNFDTNVVQNKRDTHAMVTVKDIGMLVGTDAGGALAQEWMIEWVNGVPTPQILKFGVLAVLDLHCKMEVEFDKIAYKMGEPINVTAKVNVGGEVVTNATVIAEVAGPGEGLGTFMSNNGSQLGGPVTLANLKEGRLIEVLRGASNSPDANQPKAALFQYYLSVNGMSELPTVNPVFADGTDRLNHTTTTGGGVYLNAMNKTDKEGTYTFRFLAEGTLPDGSNFRRVITISKWVGVEVDPASSPITFTALANPPSGMLGQLIVVMPKSKTGEFFGPFREGQVKIESTVGNFTGPVESRLDGSYERTLLYKRDEKPRITVSVDGTEIDQPGADNKGCIGALIAFIKKLFGKP